MSQMKHKPYAALRPGAVSKPKNGRLASDNTILVASSDCFPFSRGSNLRRVKEMEYGSGPSTVESWQSAILWVPKSNQAAKKPGPQTLQKFL